MATRHFGRVTAIGAQQDMLRLLHVLFANCAYREEDDQPAQTLEEALAQIRRYSQEEGGDECEFHYSMIAVQPFGEALDDTCRLTVREESCGLWTMTFAYEGSTPFQCEDWLELHRRAGRVLMMAQRASEDFALDKGSVIFSGGRIHESWDLMAEIWLWLVDRYEDGCEPKETVKNLKWLTKAMRREEYDMTVGELLDSCIENLTQVADVADITADSLREAFRQQDYQLLAEQQLRVAESALWETQRLDRWMAALEAARSVWAE